MKIVKAAHMGFCYGVRRAVELAMKTAEENRDGKVCTLGELIHNKQVVQKLAAENIVVAEQIPAADECAVLIIRSHGVGPDVYEQAAANGLKLVDATCPDVKKVQREARALAEDGRQVIIIGDSQHPEVQSIMKWAGEKPVVVNTAAQAQALELGARIGVVAQTTFVSNEFDEIVGILQARTADTIVKKTTCLATNKRQQAAVELAGAVDVMIVIGGKHSANTCHLAQICSARCREVHHIETAAELKKEWFTGKNTAGITAGASTPDWVIEEVVVSMEELTMQQKLDSDFKRIRTGDVVKGTVVSVQKDCAFVDIGYKGEGLLNAGELAWPVPEDCREVLNRGDEIEVEVLSTDSRDGIMLSKIKADRLTAWDKVLTACSDGSIVSASCNETVKGGVTAAVFGLRGFIPASQLDLKFVEDLAQFAGKHLHVKVLEADREKNRIVLSRRVVLQAERDAEIARFFDELTVGEIIDGTVSRLADFGAFIKLGPVDGLVPLRELSWIRVKHPGELLKTGDPVRVVVQKFERDKNRISLSIKDLQLDPWYEDIKAFREEDVTEVKVLRAQKAGVVVELAPHLEGFIPASELPADIKASEAEKIYCTGNKVRVKILRIDEQGKRIIVSQRRVQEDAERADVDKYLNERTELAAETLGDKFAGVFSKLKLQK